MACAMPAASSFGMPRTANASLSALFLPMPGSLMKASTIRPRALPDISAAWAPAFCFLPRAGVRDGASWSLTADVLYSTKLERHLYLCLQFQELGIPVVGARNMSDAAEARVLP